MLRGSIFKFNTLSFRTHMLWRANILEFFKTFLFFFVYDGGGGEGAKKVYGNNKMISSF